MVKYRKNEHIISWHGHSWSDRAWSWQEKVGTRDIINDSVTSPW